MKIRDMKIRDMKIRNIDEGASHLRLYRETCWRGMTR